MTAASVRITGAGELVKKLDRLGASLGERGLRAGLAAAGSVVVGQARANIQRHKLIDSGNLVNSIQAGKPTGSGGTVEIKIGTNAEYATVHEYGGTIRPKHAKSLAIPVSATAKKVKGPRDFPGKLFLVKTDDKVYLMGAKGKIHYILVKSVTIPARPYLRPAVDEHRGEIEQAFASGVRQVIEGIA